ncbi:oxidoreductase [Aureococcus anophagefferens]|nr:oxidoreductase [Aureococcus anophagefferens]
MFPAGVAQSGDYTSVISDAHYERATGLVAEAEAAGVEVLVCPGGDAAATGGDEESKAGAYPRRMAPTLVFDPADDLKISGEEIFGPPMVATGRQFLLQGIYPPYDKKGSMLDMIIDMKLTPAKDKAPAASSILTAPSRL